MPALYDPHAVAIEPADQGFRARAAADDHAHAGHEPPALGLRIEGLLNPLPDRGHTGAHRDRLALTKIEQAHRIEKGPGHRELGANQKRRIGDALR